MDPQTAIAIPDPPLGTNEHFALLIFMLENDLMPDRHGRVVFKLLHAAVVARNLAWLAGLLKVYDGSRPKRLRLLCLIAVRDKFIWGARLLWREMRAAGVRTCKDAGLLAAIAAEEPANAPLRDQLRALSADLLGDAAVRLDFVDDHFFRDVSLAAFVRLADREAGLGGNPVECIHNAIEVNRVDLAEYLFSNIPVQGQALVLINMCDNLLMTAIVRGHVDSLDWILTSFHRSFFTMSTIRNAFNEFSRVRVLDKLAMIAVLEKHGLGIPELYFDLAK